MRRTDAAWAAGLMDGEAAIMLHLQKPANQPGRRSTTAHVRVRVGMCDERTVRRLARMFGVGTIRVREASGKKQQKKDLYLWEVNGRKAQRILEITKPHFYTKAKLVKLALRFLRLPVWTAGGRRRMPTALQAKHLRFRKEFRALQIHKLARP